MIELAEVPPGERDGLLDVARGAVLAGRHVQFDGAPGRPRQQHDLLEQGGRAAPQRDERDLHLVEPRQSAMGRQLRIEDQVRRQGAVRPLPEVDEAKDLIGFVALAKIGVRVAERVGVGILREKDEHARLAPAAHGHVVLLDRRMLPVVGDRVKIEIEGLPRKDRLAADVGMPGGQQSHRLRVIDATGVLRQKALLRHDVEAGKQAKPVVGHQGHHVALAFDRPELQGQRRPHGMTGGDHLRARQPGVLDHAVEIEPDQVRHKQEEAATGGGKSARREREARGRRPPARRSAADDPAALRPGAGAARQTPRPSGPRGRPSDSRDVLLLEVGADLVYGVVALAQFDDQVPGGRLLGLRLRTASWRDKEDGVDLATEVVTQDVKRGHRVAERAGDVLGGPLLHEVGAERLVLALLRGLGFEEEAANVAYVFRCSVMHTYTVSPTTSCVKAGIRTPRRVASNTRLEADHEKSRGQERVDTSAVYHRDTCAIRRPLW